jgi:hypothetical protein
MPWTQADTLTADELNMSGGAHTDGPGGHFPSKGARIELLTTHMGVRPRGTVFYADGHQILVKWDDGRSQSLKPGEHSYRIIGPRPADGDDIDLESSSA